MGHRGSPPRTAWKHSTPWSARVERCPHALSLFSLQTRSYNPASGAQPHYQTYKVDINR